MSAEREWQDGDRVWLDGQVWRRQPCFGGHSWWSDVSGDAESDIGMTSAGAVLVATSAGPVPVGDIQQEWGVRYRLHATGESNGRVGCASRASALTTAADFRSSAECSLAVAQHRTVTHHETAWTDVVPDVE